MRVLYSNEKYFNDLIQRRYTYIIRTDLELSTGVINPERRYWVLLNQFRYCRQIIWAKYSLGVQVEELETDFLNALQYMYEAWMGLDMKAFKGKQKYNHYFDCYYDEMLEMLALGILLQQPKDVFKKLALIIDKDEVKDKLYEFILSKSIPERPILIEESYSEIQKIPKLFDKLRKAIDEANTIKASKLIENYFLKDFVKLVKKESGGFSAEEDIKKGNYCGYWNFSVAAISLLLKVDISGFCNNPYFPKDIYDYALNQKE